MLNKFFDSIRRRPDSNFSSYYGRLSRGIRSGGPTADEARKDFQAAISRSPWGRI